MTRSKGQKKPKLRFKIDLLKKGGFTEEQKDYFNSKSGKKEFCQCAEFFMNGFKFGLEVEKFETQEYVKPISAKYPSLPACRSSQVYYPPLYQTIYAVDGTFAKVLEPVFLVSGEFEPSTGITTLLLEKK